MATGGDNVDKITKQLSKASLKPPELRMITYNMGTSSDKKQKYQSTLLKNELERQLQRNILKVMQTQKPEDAEVTDDDVRKVLDLCENWTGLVNYHAAALCKDYDLIFYQEGPATIALKTHTTTSCKINNTYCGIAFKNDIYELIEAIKIEKCQVPYHERATIAHLKIRATDKEFIAISWHGPRKVDALDKQRFLKTMQREAARIAKKTFQLLLAAIST